MTERQANVMRKRQRKHFQTDARGADLTAVGSKDRAALLIHCAVEWRKAHKVAWDSDRAVLDFDRLRIAVADLLAAVDGWMDGLQYQPKYVESLGGAAIQWLTARADVIVASHGGGDLRTARETLAGAEAELVAAVHQYEAGAR